MNISKEYLDAVQLILRCTTDEQSTLPIIHLSDLTLNSPEHWTKSTIDQILFERLQLSNVSTHLLNRSRTSAEELRSITENRCLHYLAGCYQRLLRHRSQCPTIFNEIQHLLIDYAKTAMSAPEIYEGQHLTKQWLDLLIAGVENTFLQEFIDEIHQDLLSSNSNETESFFTDVFRHLHKTMRPLDYYSLELMSCITLIERLTRWQSLIQLMFRLSNPKIASSRSATLPSMTNSQGRAYEDTLIGSLLSKFCLPSMPGQPYFFFERPKTMSERDVELTASTMCQPIRIYQERLSTLFLAFVKNAAVRPYVLEWMGNCLADNRGKNKEWSAHNPLTGFTYASDGFLLNLNMILLNLAQPFSQPYSSKLLKIDPLYAISDNKHVHLKNLSQETPMIQREANTTQQNTDETPFHFITEIFFMAHQSYSCSVHRMHRGLLKINEELARIQSAYNDANRTLGANNDQVQQLEEAMSKGLTTFLNIKSVLNEQHLLELSNRFLTATCSWLVHLAACATDQDYDKNMDMIQKLPIRSAPHRYISYIPEFIVENVINYLTFLGRFNVKMFENLEPPVDEYITFIVVFMGDSTRLRNPHLRAGLAEALEAILPNKTHEHDGVAVKSFSKTIFIKHYLAEHLPRVLLDVFVSIELTGQAVTFEQKFNYRRPMYEILEYLWKFKEHRLQFKNLAKTAEENIDDAEAPLFLRFINLLMNDANFLLDEALTQMARLRENQEAISRGDWNDLPPQQRQDMENTFRHTGQIARYTNFMGIKTLTVLDLLTSENQSIFCYRAIAERLAAMLNYFLQHLVGPKRKNFKVRDLKEYQFDPSKLVAKVTDIYLNFKAHDDFCAAICHDGMSYNEQLFPQAVEVLQRIQHPHHQIEAFIGLGEHVKTIAAQQQEDDAAYDDAPDEYLDPITSTLMIDPVMLPTSHKIIDRATIARHLLSDQTDPFNRNPLRMQDVIPQPDLKEAIEQWKATKQKNS